MSFTKRNLLRIWHSVAIPLAGVVTMVAAFIRREPTGFIASIILFAAYWAG